MLRYHLNTHSIRPLLACALIAILGACTPSAGELQWARAALERNPQLEIVAVDEKARAFTVRVKSTGEVRVLRLDELAASSLADVTVAPIVTAQSTASQSPPLAAEPAASSASEETQPPPASIAATNDPEPLSTSPPVEHQANIAEPTYTIERENGQVKKLTGPGVSIVTRTPTKTERQADTSAAPSSEPIICEGHQFKHVDNRVINADGDAVIARDGCDLYISNSRIRATGTAIVARDSSVHIANSSIEGREASVDAAGTAKLYVRGSQLKGLSRRFDTAEIQDQGGNNWR